MSKPFQRDSIDVIRHAIYARNNLAEVIDVRSLLMELRPLYRLILVTLAAGVPVRTLFNYYSTDIYTLANEADAEFCKLLDKYREEILDET